MAKRRIEKATSRTASWTCVSRAASSLERDSHYRCDDDIALLLVPAVLGLFLHSGLVRRVYGRVMAPKGIYEYTIARTKYIDAVFREALAEGFDQILIFGAGFDTRALRFRKDAAGTTVFELDVPITQTAKVRQYERRGLAIPRNVVFIPIDFDKESLPLKLQQVGFRKDARSLFILEGVLMYLQPSSARETLGAIADLARVGSEVVFDYVHSSVLRREGLCYGESEILEAVAKAGEAWHFGLERDLVERFLSEFGLQLRDHIDGREMERLYFTEPPGRLVGRVNGTHCLVRAKKAGQILAARQSTGADSAAAA